MEICVCAQHVYGVGFCNFLGTQQSDFLMLVASLNRFMETNSGAN